MCGNVGLVLPCSARGAVLCLSPQMTGTAQQNSKAQQVHISASSGAGAAPLSVTLDPQAQLESDKRAVYRWDQTLVVLNVMVVNSLLKYNVQPDDRSCIKLTEGLKPQWVICRPWYMWVEFQLPVKTPSLLLTMKRTLQLLLCKKTNKKNWTS